MRTGRRRQRLHVVDNDLYRRAHCFGLYRRSALDCIAARFPTGVRRGEDLAFAAQVWSQAVVAYEPRAVYRLRDGSPRRASVVALTPVEEVAFISPILTSDWFASLDPERRRLLVRRCLETNLADAVAREGGLDRAGVFLSARDRLLESAPSAEALLSWEAAARLGLRRGAPVPARLLKVVPTSGAGLVDPAGPARIGLWKLRSAAHEVLQVAARPGQLGATRLS